MKNYKLRESLIDIEKQVAGHVAVGKHSSVIADEMGYSEAYIQDILYRLRKFYGAKNTIGLMIKLRMEGYGSKKN